MAKRSKMATGGEGMGSKPARQGPGGVSPRLIGAIKGAGRMAAEEAAMTAFPAARLAKVAKRIPGVEKFKRLYRNKTEAHPIDDRYRVWDKGQTAIFDEFDEAPDISDLHLEMMTVFRDRRGKGAGSKILKEVTSMADQAGVTISLEAIPKGGTMSATQLTEWYGRHGFKPHPEYDDVMVRPPAKAKAATQSRAKTSAKRKQALRKAAEARADK